MSGRHGLLRMSVRLVLVGVVALLGPRLAAADVTYVYDALDRLVRVIRDTGEAATYHYDSVGNLLSITRETGVPQGTSVTSTPPPVGRGSTPTLTLTGFNLLGATVTASAGLTVAALQPQLDALAVQLSVASNAPLGPGSLTIQAPYGSTVVPVIVQAGITISSMVPNKVVVGMAVTLTGSSFDPTPANNTVRVNGTSATVLAASATALTFRVPSGATSGLVEVTTPSASGTTAAPLTLHAMPPDRTWVPTTDLLAYWTLEQDGRDDAGSLDLTLQGGLSNNADGMFGMALDFQNTASQIAVREADASAFNFGAANFTVALWARWTSTAGEQVLLDKCDSGCAGPGWTLTKLSNQTLLLHPLVQSGANAVVAGPSYHIAVVRDGGTARLYLNGTQIAQAAAGTIGASSAPFWIGERVGPQTFPMNGRIDEVGIWRRALTPTEVAALATPVPTGPPTVASLAPARAVPGMVLTVYGANFDQGTPSTPQVQVNGVSATVLETKRNRLKVRVPAGATTGPVTVATSLGAGSSSQPLVVQSLGPQRASVPTTDLLAYWTFDEDGHDGAGDRDLTFLGGLGTVAQARLGGGLRFTADANKVAARPINDAALNFGAADFSYALWARWSALDGEHVLLDKCDAACASVGWTLAKLSATDPRGAHVLLAHPLVQSGPNPVVAGQWYHIAVVRGGSTARLYLNGTQIAQASGVGAIGAALNVFWIGERSGAQTLPFNGIIDELGIWTRALTPGEVAALAAIP